MMVRRLVTTKRPRNSIMMFRNPLRASPTTVLITFRKSSARRSSTVFNTSMYRVAAPNHCGPVTPFIDLVKGASAPIARRPDTASRRRRSRHLRSRSPESRKRVLRTTTRHSVIGHTPRDVTSGLPGPRLTIHRPIGSLPSVRIEMSTCLEPVAAGAIATLRLRGLLLSVLLLSIRHGGSVV